MRWDVGWGDLLVLNIMFTYGYGWVFLMTPQLKEAKTPRSQPTAADRWDIGEPYSNIYDINQIFEDNLGLLNKKTTPN